MLRDPSVAGQVLQFKDPSVAGQVLKKHDIE
jgi:hypothetical protein